MLWKKTDKYWKNGLARIDRIAKKASIAGKTGTAEESKSRPDHSLFVAYAPAEDPEISLAIRIANGYGSANATAVGRSIINYHFNIESQEEIVTGEASQVLNTRTD